MNPTFFFALAAEAAPSTAEAIEGLLGAEVLGTLLGVGVSFYGLYKLGTVETILKIIIGVIAVIIIMYAAGYVTPSLQSASWYKLVAFICERVPDMVLDYLGGAAT